MYLKKIWGGRLKETVLWTNPSPSASTFASQDVTLSDNLSNYKYVKFTYGSSYNNYTGDNVFSVMYDVELFEKTVATPTTYDFAACLYMYRSNGLIYGRLVRLYTFDTVIRFGACYSYKNGTAATSANTFAIPLEIIGLK